MNKDILKEIHNHILKIATIERAENNKWFFKTDKGEYGEGDKFLGLTVPETRKIAKTFSYISINEAEKLLQSKFHEERLLALFILIDKFGKVLSPALSKGKGEIQKKLREKIFNLYFKNIKYINNWDLVDTSAPRIVGRFIKEKYSLKSKNCSGVKFLNSLASDKCKYAKQSPPQPSPTACRRSSSVWRKGEGEIQNEKINLEKLWEKRIAIISCFAFMEKDPTSPNPSQGGEKIQNTNWDKSEIIFEIVKKILVEKDILNSHDLIQKACGWMLREYGKRINEKKLKEFLNENFDKIKTRRTLLRYAIEKFSEKERKEWLNKN